MVVVVVTAMIIVAIILVVVIASIIIGIVTIVITATGEVPARIFDLAAGPSDIVVIRILEFLLDDRAGRVVIDDLDLAIPFQTFQFGLGRTDLDLDIAVAIGKIGIGKRLRVDCRHGHIGRQGHCSGEHQQFAFQFHCPISLQVSGQVRFQVRALASSFSVAEAQPQTAPTDRPWKLIEGLIQRSRPLVWAHKPGFMARLPRPGLVCTSTKKGRAMLARP